MYIGLSLLAELLLVSFLILLFYRLKDRIGLAPLYIFIGANQYLQNVLAATLKFHIFDYFLSPGSIILFSSGLFTILLIYIKEGARVAQEFILGIILANLSFTLLVFLTSFQVGLQDMNGVAGLHSNLFNINLRVFAAGTTALILDAFVIVILYEFLLVRLLWLNSFFRITLALLLILNFDALVFSSLIRLESPEFGTMMIGQMLGKSLSALYFGTALFVYLRFFDKSSIQQEKKETVDIFRILTYQGRYEKLKTQNEKQKEILEKQITARRKVEQAVEESESKYRTLIEQASDSIIVYNFDGTILQSNRVARELGGYSEEELSNLKLTDLLFEEDLAHLPIQLESIKAGKTTILERRLKCKDGSAVSVEVNSRMMPDHTVMTIGRDLTERKKAEKDLAESEYRMRMILQTEPECVKVLNIKGELIDMNPAGLAMVEADNLEMIKGKTLLSVVNAPYKKAFSDLTKDVFKGKSRKLEFEITGLKGTLRWLETHAVPMRDLHGTIVSLLGVTRDVTESKKAAQAIEASEANYRTLVEQAADGIAIADQSFRFIEINDRFSKMVGYTKEELRVMEMRQLAVIDSGESPLRFKDLREDKSLLTERILKRKDGTIFSVELSSTRMKNGNYLSIVRDISERKLAEKALRASEEVRKLVMESALDAIVCIDLSDTITVWNPQAEKIFGWTEAEIRGKTLAETIIPMQHREKHLEGMKRFKQSGTGAILNKTIEITGLKRNGNEFPIELSVVPIRQGDTEFFCAFIRDITERKKALEQISLNEMQLHQLTAHLQTVREEERVALSRELHDELGQQLTAIKMDLSWLKNNFKNDKLVSIKLVESIKLTDEAVTSIRRINSELRPTLLDNFGLFVALDQQLAHFAKRSGIQCDIQITIEEPTIEYAKSIAIFRIFQETLTNVARHAEAKIVRATINGASDHLELIIQDDGKGFIERETTIIKSFGILGMKERANMIGGALEIVSKPGEGTSIRLFVPL